MTILKLILLFVEYALPYLREQRIKGRLDDESAKRVDRLAAKWANTWNPERVSGQDPNLFREEAVVRDDKDVEVSSDTDDISKSS